MQSHFFLLFEEQPQPQDFLADVEAPPPQVEAAVAVEVAGLEVEPQPPPQEELLDAALSMVREAVGVTSITRSATAELEDFPPQPPPDAMAGTIAYSFLAALALA